MLKGYKSVFRLNRPLSLWWSFIGIILVAVFSLTAFSILGSYQKLQSQGSSLSQLNQQANQNQGSQKTKENNITGDRLEIPKLNIKAPIVFDVSGANEKAYLKALEGGVAHLAGSPRPNEAGNTFIFGHSQYYKLRPGNYKEVFKELDKLIRDDEFSIFYQDKEIKYKVVENKIVKFDDWSIQDGPTAKDPKDKTITIMTCWPPGTLKARRAIFAVQL